MKRGVMGGVPPTLGTSCFLGAVRMRFVAFPANLVCLSWWTPLISSVAASVAAACATALLASTALLVATTLSAATALLTASGLPLCKPLLTTLLDLSLIEWLVTGLGTTALLATVPTISFQRSDAGCCCGSVFGRSVPLVSSREVAVALNSEVQDVDHLQINISMVPSVFPIID